MAIYVQRYCPRCGNQIESFTRDYRGIGSPFEKCDSCGQLIVLDHINEWDVRNPFEKLVYYGIFVWTAVLRGFIPALGYVFLTAALGADTSEETFLWLWGIGIVGMLFWLGAKIHREIEASRDRMDDEQYQDLVLAVTKKRKSAA